MDEKNYTTIRFPALTFVKPREALQAAHNLGAKVDRKAKHWELDIPNEILFQVLEVLRPVLEQSIEV